MQTTVQEIDHEITYQEPPFHHPWSIGGDARRGSGGIAMINAWNRINVTTRQIAGSWAEDDGDGVLYSPPTLG